MCRTVGLLQRLEAEETREDDGNVLWSDGRRRTGEDVRNVLCMRRIKARKRGSKVTVEVC